LREALAATNHDYIAREERSAATRRRDKSGKGKPSIWRRLFGGRRTLGALLFLGFAAVVAIGVPVNALFLQDGRHPAPIFRQAGVSPQPGTAPQSEAARQRPASAVVAKSEASAQETAKSEAAKASEKTRDPISQLLQGGSTQKKAETNEKNKTVLAAQRALAKLGFALHQDGVFGGTTRQAIEKFERANGMPVKGELSAKLRHLLSARTGIAVK
jgi:hypothetical protein